VLKLNVGDTVVYTTGLEVKVTNPIGTANYPSYQGIVTKGSHHHLKGHFSKTWNLDNPDMKLKKYCNTTLYKILKGEHNA